MGERAQRGYMSLGKRLALLTLRSSADLNIADVYKEMIDVLSGFGEEARQIPSTRNLMTKSTVSTTVVFETALKSFFTALTTV